MKFAAVALLVVFALLATACGASGAGGAAGSTGAAGATGPTGVTGPKGATGLTGATGATGATGPQGLRGSDGFDGEDGKDGSDGAKGATGPAGANGATGVAGATGATGTTGATGATGPAGAVGPTGATGAIGATGPAGATGATGPGSISAYTYGYNVNNWEGYSKNIPFYVPDGMRSGVGYNSLYGKNYFFIQEGYGGLYEVTFTVGTSWVNKSALVGLCTYEADDAHFMPLCITLPENQLSTYSKTVLLRLEDNYTLSLRNYSAGLLELSDSGASIVIKRVAD